MGFPNPFKKNSSIDDSAENDHAKAKRVRRILRTKYDDLGPINLHEGSVLVLFVSLVLLWFFRDPKFMPGWGNFVHVE